MEAPKVNDNGVVKKNGTPAGRSARFRTAVKRNWKKQLVKVGLAKYEEELESELAQEVVEEVKERPNQCSECREKGRHILHSKHVLRSIVALCIIDCIMVMVELILDNAAIRNDIVDKYGLAGGGCADTHQDSNNSTTESARRRRAAASGGDHGDDEAHGAHSTWAIIAHYCHYVSVTILCILTLEVSIKIFCFGKKFFHSKLEVFDAFVVIASLVVDMVLLDGVTNDPPLLSSAIVNLLLPWRIIRVVNSLVIATKDHEHFKLMLVYKAKREIEDMLDLTNKEFHLSQKRTEMLLEMCKKAGVHQAELNQCMGLTTASSCPHLTPAKANHHGGMKVFMSKLFSHSPDHKANGTSVYAHIEDSIVNGNSVNAHIEDPNVKENLSNQKSNGVRHRSAEKPIVRDDGLPVVDIEDDVKVTFHVPEANGHTVVEIDDESTVSSAQKTIKPGDPDTPVTHL